MIERRYKRGINREQETLFPPRLDDYVSATHTVRAIDAYVESLELDALGFRHAKPVRTEGQPPYSPAALLKLYLYGYLNRLRSSRVLERECRRNVEVMWLLEGLCPSYKTIADFRKDNPKALRATQSDFIQLCRELDLFGGQCVAVDGSFFKGNVSAKSFVTQAGLQRQIEAIERDIAQWHEQLDQADGQEWDVALEDPQLDAKLAELKVRKELREAELANLQEEGRSQRSRTDPDARLLNKRGNKLQGYNVQIVTDTRHHLLLASEVTTEANDLAQLHPMVALAQEPLGVAIREVLADAGYHSAGQINRCVQAGITPYVPEPSRKGQGGERFGREAFTYDSEQNAYCCPAGRWLHPLGSPRQAGDQRLQRYVSRRAECTGCAQRARCLSARSSRRELWRSDLEAVLEAHRQRMAENPGRMAERAASAEHPFGTLKRRCGWDHFLLRGLEKVRGEWSLMALGYNFTRVLNLIGLNGFLAYCRQRGQGSLPPKGRGPEAMALAPSGGLLNVISARVPAHFERHGLFSRVIRAVSILFLRWYRMPIPRFSLIPG